MARPHVADGGMASKMDGSCEYILIIIRRQPRRGGHAAWGLGEMLKTPHSEKTISYET